MCAVLNRRVRSGPDKLALREVEHLGKKKLRRRAEMRHEIHWQDLIMSRRERGDSSWRGHIDRNETHGVDDFNTRDRRTRNAGPSRSGLLLAGLDRWKRR